MGRPLQGPGRSEKGDSAHHPLVVVITDERHREKQLSESVRQLTSDFWQSGPQYRTALQREQNRSFALEPHLWQLPKMLSRGRRPGPGPGARAQTPAREREGQAAGPGSPTPSPRRQAELGGSRGAASPVRVTKRRPAVQEDVTVGVSL